MLVYVRVYAVELRLSVRHRPFLHFLFSHFDKKQIVYIKLMHIDRETGSQNKQSFACIHLSLIILLSKIKQFSLFVCLFFLPMLIRIMDSLRCCIKPIGRFYLSTFKRPSWWWFIVNKMKRDSAWAHSALASTAKLSKWFAHTHINFLFRLHWLKLYCNLKFIHLFNSILFFPVDKQNLHVRDVFAEFRWIN